jgi:general secretion pathway protein E
MSIIHDEAVHPPIHDQLNRVLLEQLESKPAVTAVAGPALARALLEDALRERATDIHLDPQGGGVRVRFRIDGVLLDGTFLTHDQGQHLINQYKTMARLDPLPPYVPRESAFVHELEDRELDVRVTTVMCVGGEKTTLRLLDPRRLTTRIHQLGLDDDKLRRIQLWLDNINGMFLVTGPTGSGKTTTLYALLHELKQTQRSVVTIEDPVECPIDGITQLQVNDERGLTFAEGIQAMLRLDPDYLHIGEIRDAESGRAAIDAVSSGRVLLGTLHSRDAVGTITGLRSWNLTDHEIAATLSVVVAQRLVRVLCPECRRHAAIDESDRRWLEELGREVPDRAWQPGRCRSCDGIGYRGQTGIFEIWQLDEEDFQLILDHADERKLRSRLAAKSHAFLLCDALAKANAGVTSIAEVRAMGGFGFAAANVARDRSPSRSV